MVTMKQYLFKMSVWSAALLMLHGAGFSQVLTIDTLKKDDDKDAKVQEIIIKKKGDKDSKFTVEIKDGQVLINGKPAEQFDDADISVRKYSGDWGDGAALIPPMPPMPPHSPFRGGAWSFKSDDNVFFASNTAFLGVSSEKARAGGAQIESVTEGSAAEKIGLKKGDDITKIDSENISDPEDLTKTIRKHKPEDKVVVTYTRDGKEQKATATLGKSGEMKYFYNFKMPRVSPDIELNLAPRVYSWNSSASPRLGIKAQDTENGKGVKVLDVDDESPAEKAGLKEGDIITSLDGKPVNGAGELAETYRASRTKPSIKIKIIRNGKPLELDVKIPRKLKTADL